MKKHEKAMEEYRKEILANHVRESRKAFKFNLNHYGSQAFITMRQSIIYSTYEKLYFELYHETIE